MTGFVDDDDETEENREEATNLVENLLTMISTGERQQTPLRVC